MEQEKLKISTKREIARQAYLRALGLSNMSEARMKEAEVSQADREMDNLLDKMQNTKIISPYAGQVMTPNLQQKIGENVGRGAVVGEVVDLSRLQIKFSVPQEQLRYMAAGQEIHFKVSSYPARTFKVKVEQIGIGAETKADQVLYTATASIENPDGTLRAGMSGRGKLLAGTWRPLDQLLEQPAHWFKMNWGW